VLIEKEANAELYNAIASFALTPAKVGEEKAGESRFGLRWTPEFEGHTPSPIESLL
jgi:hypothetical protein